MTVLSHFGNWIRKNMFSGDHEKPEKAICRIYFIDTFGELMFRHNMIRHHFARIGPSGKNRLFSPTTGRINRNSGYYCSNPMIVTGQTVRSASQNGSGTGENR